MLEHTAQTLRKRKLPKQTSLRQRTNRVGSRSNVDLGYKLAIAKNKKSIANGGVNIREIILK
jgi:hypothetical protein